MKLILRFLGMLLHFSGGSIYTLAFFWANKVRRLAHGLLWIGSFFITHISAAEPLHKGQALPDLGELPVINYSSRVIRLSDYKNKLLILDFWATTCGSCLEAIPGIAALQRQFKDKVQLVDVDYEKATYVSAYLARRKEISTLGLPVIAGDVSLSQLFPHQYLPHIVWIRNGVFVAATDGDHLNAGNIAGVLANPHFDPGQADDAVTLNPAVPLIGLSPVFNSAKTAFYSSLTIAGYVPGAPLKSGWTKDSGVHINEWVRNSTRFYAVNHPLLNLYALALNSGLPFLPNRRLIPSADSALLLDNSGKYEDDWARTHSYTIEISMPAGTSKGVFMASLLQQLEGSFDLYATIEKMRRNCLVLSRGSSLKPSKYPDKQIELATGKAPLLHHIDLDDLVWLLNEQPGMPPVVTTGQNAAFDLDLSELPLTEHDWINALAKNGLQLLPEVRELDMFVVHSMHE